MTLTQEQGDFYLNNPNSEYCTFAYSGDQKFLERMETLFFNYGILESGEIHTIKDNFNYILTPLQRLQSGLIELFKGEIITSTTNSIDKAFKEIRDGEGDLIDYEVSWDESKVEELARAELEKFMGRCRTEPVAIYYRNSYGTEAYKISENP